MVTGSLRIQNGIYHASINLYNEDGKRIQKTVTTKLPVKGNKRKAEEFLKKLQEEYEGKEAVKLQKSGGERVKDKDIPVADFIRDWLQITKTTIERSTFESY
jgi:hypothetical protein